jgi:hypothetical protein
MNGAYERDPQTAAGLLDGVLRNGDIVQYYRRLQAAVPTDAQGTKRLLQSLEMDNIPVTSYRSIAYNHLTEALSGNDFKTLVLKIAAKPDGFDVALEILIGRIHSPNGQLPPPELAIIETGRTLLTQIQFTKNNNHTDYSIGEIIKSCLQGNEGIQIVEAICRKLKLAMSKYEVDVFTQQYLLDALFSVHPVATLEGLLGDMAQREIGVQAREEIPLIWYQRKRF